ncbi:Holliday junction resolvase RuvX [Planctomonas deserti]|uniref:Holliday junction resolvase RuvX n=1 Tax=Planctomonas deserti TaxID=2144185 RepID=UPI000D3A8FBF|nr:Holliday junction resolvase RuvX [Planctomonas deserti]
MRRGVRIGVDVGKARIGVARSDPSGLIATPVVTVARAADGDADVREILAAATEHDAIEIVVGLPLSLSGGRTPSTDDAERFAERIAAASPLPVRLIDERLSTVSAQSALSASGRNTRKSRPVIDQVAAVIILQHALDSERAGGSAPGTVVLTEGP